MTIKQRTGQIIIKALPVSPELFSVLRNEFRAFRTRINYKINPVKRMAVRKFLSVENISLNIGCGPFGQDGWVNIDLMKLKNVSFTYDSRKQLPFKNQTVERVRVEHFFEHLDKSFEVPFFLKECKRVMKQGAVLRIVVPDVEKFIIAYNKNDKNTWINLGFDIDRLPKDFDTKIAILNHIFRQNGEHKYAYDYESLKFTLLKFGFKSIAKQQYRVSLDERLQDDLENHSNYSLYVDCVK